MGQEAARANVYVWRWGARRSMSRRCHWHRCRPPRDRRPADLSALICVRDAALRGRSQPPFCTPPGDLNWQVMWGRSHCARVATLTGTPVGHGPNADNDHPPERDRRAMGHAPIEHGRDGLPGCRTHGRPSGHVDAQRPMRHVQPQAGTSICPSGTRSPGVRMRPPVADCHRASASPQRPTDGGRPPTRP